MFGSTERRERGRILMERAERGEVFPCLVCKRKGEEMRVKINLLL